MQNRPTEARQDGFLPAGWLPERRQSDAAKVPSWQDKIVATERLARIMRLWQWKIEKRPEPEWGPFLDIARAIAKGDSDYVVAADRFSNDGAYQIAIEAWQNPVIPVVAEDKRKQFNGQIELDALDTILQANAKRRNANQDSQPQSLNEWRELVGKKPAKGSLHSLLHGYSQLCEKKYHDADYDTISDNGKMRQRHCKTLLRLLPDMPLSRLDYTELDDVYNTLRSRPKKDDGKPFAFNYCQHLMQTLTRVLDWADTSQDYGWELPPKFSRISKVVKRLEIDNEKDIDTPIYAIQELTLLWQLARPNERLLMALALNCGMGADQIGRLTINRIKLHDDRPSYIKSRRFKKDVIGRWRLCLNGGQKT